MISIGLHMRGPELDCTPMFHAVSSVMRQIAEARDKSSQHCERDDDSYDSPISAVNVVFYVPGSLGGFGKPTVEAARFSRKKKLLLVAVVVPKNLVHSPDALRFVIDTLYQANAIAEQVFAKKGAEPFDRDKADAIVADVAQRVMP